MRHVKYAGSCFTWTARILFHVKRPEAHGPTGCEPCPASADSDSDNVMPRSNYPLRILVQLHRRIRTSHRTLSLHVFTAD